MRGINSARNTSVSIAHCALCLPLFLAVTISIAAITSVSAAPPSQTSTAPKPSNGRFEGVIDMRLTMETGGGDLQLYLAGDMAKLDMQVTVNPLPEPIRMSVLMDSKQPKTVWLINDRLKTYSPVDLTAAIGLAEEGKGVFQAKVLGQENLLGYPTTHVTLARDKELIDAWVTSELPDVYSVLKRLQEANPQIGEAALFHALEATGHAGLPMRCVVIRDGQRVTTEVKKVERKTLAAGLFSVPKDYQRMEGGLPPQMLKEPSGAHDSK